MDATTITQILAGMLVLMLSLLYFYPTFKAMGKRNTGAIFALNLLTGWSVIGWCVALIWALKNDTVALRTDELQRFIRRDRQIKVAIYTLFSMVAVILAIVMVLRYYFPASQPKTQESTAAGQSGQQQPEPTAANHLGDAGSSTAPTTQTMQTVPITTVTATGETVTTTMGNSPVDAEARVEALKVLEGMLTQCG